MVDYAVPTAPPTPTPTPTTGGTPCRVDAGRVVLDVDGASVQVHPRWLRERTADPVERDVSTGQRLVEPQDVDENIAVVSAEIVDAVAGPELVVGFDDGHVMRIAVADMLGGDPTDPPEPEPWRAAPDTLPWFDFHQLTSQSADERDGMMLALLDQYFRHGWFLLRGTPARVGALHEITAPFGRIAATNFGTLFDVRSTAVPTDLAYTAVALSAHTDQPYRRPTPGLQFLHVIRNDAPGGASTVVDGLAAVDDLRRIDPDGHRVLCETVVEFRYDIGVDVKVDRAPMIDRAPDGRLRRLRFSPRLDFAPLIDPDVLDVYYRARRTLARLLDDPARRVEVDLGPGDVVVVDNHRVLHGRTSFDPTVGDRHLQGCYIDHDGPDTCWRLAVRRNGARR